jgi:hypothetical protein
MFRLVSALCIGAKSLVTRTRMAISAGGTPSAIAPATWSPTHSTSSE